MQFETTIFKALKMKAYKSIFLSAALLSMNVSAQKFKSVETDSSKDIKPIDTTIYLKDVNYVTFKNPDDQMEFYKDLSRIRIVLPYVKMAKTLYGDVLSKKEDSKKKDYRHYRKDIEKEMRDKFEKELKNLTVGQGKVLVKLINRETGNNCYQLIKEVKSGFSAWTWQIVARHWDYDLKEKYDPNKERILELAIKAIGSEYDVK